MGRGWKKDVEKGGGIGESGGTRKRLALHSVLHTPDPSTSIPIYRSRKSSRGKASSVVDCVSTEKCAGSRRIGKIRKEGFSIDLLRLAIVFLPFLSVALIARSLKSKF